MNTRLSLVCLLCALWSLPAGAAAPALQTTARGEGPVILFLGGLNVHGDMWRPWLDALAVDHRVLAVTPAGFAGAAPTDIEAGFFATYVPALARLLAAERSEDATVVGHSLGGVAALLLAAAAPDRVGRLLVVDCLPFVAEMVLPGATPAQAEQTAAAMAARSLALARDAYRAETERTIAIMAKSGAFLDRLRAWAAASDRATAVAAFKEMLSLDLRPQLPGIRQPVLALAAWDAAMPLTRERVEALYKSQFAGLPRGEVRVVEDSLHFLMIDQPAAFDSALTEVLAR